MGPNFKMPSEIETRKNLTKGSFMGKDEKKNEKPYKFIL
jgi:hypothetical protein